MRNVCWIGLVVLAGLMQTGCDRPAAKAEPVVLYTSVDEPVSRPIIQEFTKATGIEVVLRTDTEATKSVGLAERLEAEKDNPQADVWWGNEVFHTINLAERGVLASHDSPAMAQVPAMYRDGQNRWAGTALRARVIARTTASPGQEPAAKVHSILDLKDPALKGKICMARPSAGTTSGQMAALYTLLGPAKMEQLLRDWKANGMTLLGGNAVVAEYVGRGQMWAGLTDNDDVDSARQEGGKLELVLPDQGSDQFGTLTIPCTVGLVKGAKHEQAAKKLVNYLLSPEVERKLLEAKFARYSVFAQTGADTVKGMAVDYRQVAGNLRAAVEMAMKILEGRE